MLKIFSYKEGSKDVESQQNKYISTYLFEIESRWEALRDDSKPFYKNWYYFGMLPWREVIKERIGRSKWGSYELNWVNAFASPKSKSLWTSLGYISTKLAKA